MVAVPIKQGAVLLGVLQILNQSPGGVFGTADAERAQDLARVIGQKYRYDLRGTNGPFQHLVDRRHIDRERLGELQNRARQETTKVVQLLLEEGLSAAAVGESLEHYYQGPFLPFDPDSEPPQIGPRPLQAQLSAQQPHCPGGARRQHGYGGRG